MRVDANHNGHAPANCVCTGCNNLCIGFLFCGFNFRTSLINRKTAKIGSLENFQLPYSGKFCWCNFRISDQKPHRINFHVFFLARAARPCPCSLPTTNVALHDNLSPGLFSFYYGLMLTDLWVDHSKTLAKHWLAK